MNSVHESFEDERLRFIIKNRVALDECLKQNKHGFILQIRPKFREKMQVNNKLYLFFNVQALYPAK